MFKRFLGTQWGVVVVVRFFGFFFFFFIPSKNTVCVRGISEQARPSGVLSSELSAF